MEYRKIGNTGLKVSEIAYGSWLTFAHQVELENAKKIVNRAFELGINYIDTADAYNGGDAESLLGEILPRYNRSRYIVASKAYWPMSDAPTDRGLSRKHITDSVHASLERLKLSYMDIFYCHRFDPESPLAETLEAINDLIRQGKILYWGTSEWTADQIIEANEICIEQGWSSPVINQPNYSLVKRGIEHEILPACINNGMGTANFSPLAQGILTGKYSGGKIPEGSRAADDSLKRFIMDMVSDTDLLSRVDELGSIAKSYDLTTGQLSLAWILQNPGISSLIAGASTVEQLESNVKASGVKIKAADMIKIDALFPLQ
ncbi:aldo/keto reductase family protein [Oceanispirochaeta sp.]|jgi:voltage-dependent potassium channel beta subunit|uniref:aldo/keto reductase family protein n=1 Tax=Oceanispirochaeta sp. TaxID=2035350 RepID=UPI00262B0687|nr:aldo/keto reductase family protein [Oceanispirochaeta sp.]MDA3955703.1 aldo/keto reductase family protein [Oceanispirochaeta sp.]